MDILSYSFICGHIPHVNPHVVSFPASRFYFIQRHGLVLIPIALPQIAINHTASINKIPFKINNWFNIIHNYHLDTTDTRYYSR